MKPHIYYFNPTCEMEVANNHPYYMPPAQVTNMLEDGACLPIYFCNKDDRVVVSRDRSTEFMKGLEKLGIKTDAFLSMEQLEGFPAEQFEFHPWGKSPMVAEKFKEIIFTNRSWSPEQTQFYRRESAIEVLNGLIADGQYYSTDLLPEVCTSVEEVEVCIRRWNQVVVKAPLSSSGRGVQFLRKPYLNTANEKWIESVLNQQKSVIVEPLFDRVFDFSMHFFKAETSINPLGISAFQTNNNGKYLSNYLGSILEHPSCPAELSQEKLNEIQSHLQTTLESSSAYKNYRGPLGVDLFAFRLNETLHIQPCVEINARYSMGYLSLQLKSLLAENSVGEMKNCFKKDVNESEFFLNVKNGKVQGAYWPLNDYWNSKQFVFMLEVQSKPA